MQKYFDRIRLPSLEKLLFEPERYSVLLAVGGILKSMAGFYGLRQEKLRKTGTDEAGQSLAVTVAQSEYAAIVQGKLEEADKLQAGFSNQYDNQLLSFARRASTNYRRMEQFFYDSLCSLAEKDPTARKKLRNGEAREKAFHISIASFLGLLRKEGFVFEKNARSLFFYIFLLKCQTELSYLTDEKRYLEVNFEKQQLHQYQYPIRTRW